MYNHIRTLLLNISGDNAPGPGYPWEEAVPSDYRAFEPPGWLASIRTVLFGQSPDRAMMNYRLRQYMTAVHGVELDEYARSLDMRLTYDPHRPKSAWPDAITVTGSDRPIYISGTPAPDEVLGRLRTEWRVSTSSGNAVTVLRETHPTTTTTWTPSVTNGLTADITLTPGLRIAVDPTPGSVWHVTAHARPTRGLPEIVAALRQSGDRLPILFGNNPPEPYKTFQALWDSHPFLPYQLGGLIMAVAYRSHDVWRKETV